MTEVSLLSTTSVLPRNGTNGSNGTSGNVPTNGSNSASERSSDSSAATALFVHQQATVTGALDPQDEDQTIVIDLTEDRNLHHLNHASAGSSGSTSHHRKKPSSLILRKDHNASATSSMEVQPPTADALLCRSESQEETSHFLISKMLNGQSEEAGYGQSDEPDMGHVTGYGQSDVLRKGVLRAHTLPAHSTMAFEKIPYDDYVEDDDDDDDHASHSTCSSCSLGVDPAGPIGDKNGDHGETCSSCSCSLDEDCCSAKDGQDCKMAAKAMTLPAKKALPAKDPLLRNGTGKVSISAADIIGETTLLPQMTSRVTRPKELNVLKTHRPATSGPVTHHQTNGSAHSNGNTTSATMRQATAQAQRVINIAAVRRRSRSLRRDGPVMEAALAANGGSTSLSQLQLLSSSFSETSPLLFNTNASNTRFHTLSSSYRLRSGELGNSGRGSLDRRHGSGLQHQIQTRKSASSDFLDRMEISSSSEQTQRKKKAAKARKVGRDGRSKMNKIEPQLYLGNMEAATDVILLESTGITHIVTLDSVPLPRKIASFLPKVSNLHLQVTDLVDEDILSCVNPAVAFINTGLNSGGCVLVHCFRGKSRSASIVIAYLMQKYDYPYEKAFKKVKAKRDCINPHEGFRAQLRLYEAMECNLDPSNVQFKMFKLRLASERMRKAKILFRDSLEHVLDSDPGEKGSAKGNYPMVYKCKRCRRTLATAHNLMPHVEGEAPHWEDPKWSMPTEEILEGASDLGLKLCSGSLFINPITWMQSEIKQNLGGRLYCPNCQCKVGQYTWVRGCECDSCGVNIAPAFQLDVTEIIYKTKNRYLQNTGREPVLV